MSDVNEPASPITPPDVLAFLRFLDHCLAREPGHIVSADPAQIARIAKLIEGVKTD